MACKKHKGQHKNRADYLPDQVKFLFFFLNIVLLQRFQQTNTEIQRTEHFNSKFRGFVVDSHENWLKPPLSLTKGAISS